MTFHRQKWFIRSHKQKTAGITGGDDFLTSFRQKCMRHGLARLVVAFAVTALATFFTCF
ncbi:hypothetical protein GXU00_001775 [Escherichia coli]|nr:hypothetical protein [Escherichia coli]EFI4229792.1 hypothetical protein [Escherichia coli]EFI4366906.1 hypothetical protein [Escherichia coli]